MTLNGIFSGNQLSGYSPAVKSTNENSTRLEQVSSSSLETPQLAYAEDILDLSDSSIMVDMTGLKSTVKDKAWLDYQTTRLDTKVNDILDQNKIKLDANDTFNFFIDQDGKIKVTDGIKNAQKREEIENALNSDPKLGQELLNLYASKAEVSGRLNDISRAILGHDPVTKPNGEVRELPKDYKVEFSYRNGVTMSREEQNALKSSRTAQSEFNFGGSRMSRTKANGDESLFGTEIEGDNDMRRYEKMIFGNDPIDKLAKLTGVKSSATDKKSFLDSLNRIINQENQAIQDELNSAVKKEEIDLGKRRVTFSIDSEGKVFTGGIKDGVKISKLNTIINENSDLSERMGGLKAKMEVFDRVLNDDGIDLSAEENSGLRKELLKTFLRENGGLDLEAFDITSDPETGNNKLKFADNADGKMTELLAENDWLEREIIEVIEYENTPDSQKVAEAMKSLNKSQGVENEDVKSLLWYKNGTISEAIEADPINLGTVRGQVFSMPVNYFDEKGNRLSLGEAIDHYNGKHMNSPELQIKDFTLVLADKSRGKKDGFANFGISAEGVVAGDGSTSGDNVASLQRIISSWLTNPDFYEGASGAGKMVLENHDIQHGDVEDYQHDVTFTLSGKNMIRSEEADQAALADIKLKTDELSVELGGYLRENFIKSNSSLSKEETESILSMPVNVTVKEDGQIAFDGTGLDRRLSSLISKTFDILNERVVSDDPFGDGFTHDLPGGLKRSLELLCGIRDDLDRIHDPENKKIAFPISLH